MAEVTSAAAASCLSAPEILLAVVESILRLGKPAGELGPSTIVGSAAYNLMMIAAVCTAALPTGGGCAFVKRGPLSALQH